MAKINTLIRKGYLLAGVIMAANMFVVNEMRAMEELNEEKSGQTNPNDLNIKSPNVNGEGLNTETNPQMPQGSGSINPKDKKKKNSDAQGLPGSLLYLENTINLVGGALFTLANSFYKFYENKPSFYFDYYFAGWNSKPFAKGYLQFCPNINLGRGIFWLIATFLGSYEYLIGKKSPKELTNTAGLMANKIVTVFKKASFKVFYLIFSILQGFISMPLTFHFSNFSISISLDSMIWGIVGMILEPKDKKDLGEQIEKMIDEKKDDKQEEIKN